MIRPGYGENNKYQPKSENKVLRESSTITCSINDEKNKIHNKIEQRFRQNSAAVRWSHNYNHRSKQNKRNPQRNKKDKSRAKWSMDTKVEKLKTRKLHSTTKIHNFVINRDSEKQKGEINLTARSS